MAEIRKLTRREALASVGGLVVATTTGCLVANPEAYQAPYPTATKLPSVTPTPRPPATPPEGTGTPEGLPALFNTIINQAESLARDFPEVFIDAATLRNDLTALHQSGDLFIQSLSTPNPNLILLATVRPLLVSSPAGQIEGLRPQLYVNPIISTFQPAEQVIAMTHEVSHTRDQRIALNGVLDKLKGQPASPENIGVVEREINRLAFQMESKELFKNCTQLFAVRSKNPNFRTRYPFPFDLPLPNSTDRTKTIYSVYLEVKDTPEPENDPRWKAAVQNFVLPT